MYTETIDYRDGNTQLEAYAAYDNAIREKRPAVLIAHAWGGRDAFVEEKARRLAEMGYVGFAIDVYGKGVLGDGIETNRKLMKPFIDDRVLLRRRLFAALETAKKLRVVDSNKIAVMGYCFGGLCALDIARSGIDLKGVVSFHGLLKSPENIPTKKIKAKILVLQGYDDPMVPSDAVLAFEKEMTNSGADWQLHIFGGTMHGFTNPEAKNHDFGIVFNVLADKRSWIEMTYFFHEIFA